MPVMAPFRSALAERLNTVQLTWVGVLTLVIATTAVDGPAALAGTALAIALIFAVSGDGALSQLHRLAAPSAGPPREERHLRGAFRRQSAPNTPGRPRRPRAPGQALAAA
ncbi:hypothetical protein A6409_02685 [Prescottella equi]|nr:hypothetical protein A6409_02685 [Prescottella equi]